MATPKRAVSCAMLQPDVASHPDGSEATKPAVSHVSTRGLSQACPKPVPNFRLGPYQERVVGNLNARGVVPQPRATFRGWR